MNTCTKKRGIPDIPRTVAETPWSHKGLGNHRVILSVNKASEVLIARIPWRRRDLHPERIGVRLFEMASNRDVSNIIPVKITREQGVFIFEAQNPGLYALYFMPFDIEGKAFYAPHVNYRSADYSAADRAWRKHAEKQSKLPEAEVSEIQARTEMDRFDPMELISTEDDIQALLSRYPDSAFLIFPETRSAPIRMTQDIPCHWSENGPASTLKVQAQPNEFLTFQLGIFAIKALSDITVHFHDLTDDDGSILPAEALTCFNTEGVDWLGKAFKKQLNISAGEIQPLWLGIDIPKNGSGIYSGEIEVRAAGVASQRVKLFLNCTGDILEDRGDSDLWKHARLRWLNSSIGLSSKPLSPYTGIDLQEKDVSILGRKICFGLNALPKQISSYFSPSVDRLQDDATDILHGPIELSAEAGQGALTWQQTRFNITQNNTGTVTVESASKADGLSLQASTIMEFDGHIDCRLQLKALNKCSLNDLVLKIPLRKEVATYMMGLGRKGGFRPAEWQYRWNIDRSNHYCWLGAVHAGLHLKLKHDADVWNQKDMHSTGAPAGWYNNGNGGCSINEESDSVLIRAYCGTRELEPGETISLRFSLIITPLKCLDLKQHWQQRYHHIDCWDGSKPDIDEAKRVGATVVNLHQGGRLNPYINYPFPFASEIKQEVGKAHEAELKYKLYYTVRELSHHAEEIWAFRSLNGEIYKEKGSKELADYFDDVEERNSQNDTSGPWLKEHLINHYVPAWQQFLPNDEMDQAIATTSLSRLHNYYLEGLSWLIQELGIDGIYLDGVGYDRQIMKRVRHVLDQSQSGCLVDFHNGNTFHNCYGLNNVLGFYMELLPYIDSLWIGEGFDNDETPDYYMTEICGIPFGLSNNMLQSGGNPWRGMIYGMTCRYGWQQGGDPQHIWQLWQDFNIEQAQMFGYWVPDCPVKTDHPQILATAYVHPNGKTLVALASWADEDESCTLNVNWKRLGLTEKAKLTAPHIPGFQEAKCMGANTPITIAQGKGLLLLLE